MSRFLSQHITQVTDDHRSWVIYAFAAAFLALAYQRGAIGGTFSDRTLEEAGASSLLSRLLGLGVDLFDQACAGSSNHSAGQYCEVLRSLVKATCAPGEAIEVSHESGGDGGSSNAFGSLQGLDMEFLNQLGLNGYTYTDFRYVLIHSLQSQPLILISDPGTPCSRSRRCLAQ